MNKLRNLHERERPPGSERKAADHGLDSMASQKATLSECYKYPVGPVASTQESWEELIERLTQEFAPMNVRSIASRAASRRDLVMQVTREWAERKGRPEC